MDEGFFFVGGGGGGGGGGAVEFKESTQAVQNIIWSATQSFVCVRSSLT